MNKANALELRRALGRVLARLERDGKPIVIEKGREPKAVLISIRDYRERFADVEAAEEREQLAEDILALRARSRRSRRSAVDLVRELRGPLP
jgi:prevent-host-death family protein